MYVCTIEEFISGRCSHIAVQVWSEITWIGHQIIYKCLNRLEKTLDLTLRCHTINCSWIGWELLLAGTVIVERFVTWDGHSRVSNVLHTYKVGIVSMGKFIDTIVAGATSLLEKLWIAVNTLKISELLELADITTILTKKSDINALLFDEKSFIWTPYFLSNTKCIHILCTKLWSKSTQYLWWKLKSEII